MEYNQGKTEEKKTEDGELGSSTQLHFEAPPHSNTRHLRRAYSFTAASQRHLLLYLRGKRVISPLFREGESFPLSIRKCHKPEPSMYIRVY